MSDPTQGQPIQGNRVDQGGGFLNTSQVRLLSTTLANPGVFTIAFIGAVNKHSPRLKLGAGPWTVKVYNVTGADEDDLNFEVAGTLVLTRTGDTTASCAVNTTGQTYVFGTDCYIDGVEVEEQDANMPSHTARDVDMV